MQAMLPPRCNNSGSVQNRYYYADENACRESDKKPENGIDNPS
jgi:hypothetical protein